MYEDLDFNILDVVYLLGIQTIGKRRGGTQDCVCPFCGSKTGSFAVSVYNHSGKVVNLYRCLRTSCDAKGNMVQLYMRVKGIDNFRQAVKEISMAMHGDYHPVPFDNPLDLGSVDKHCACLNDDALDMVYRKMYSYLRLSARDKADLIRRGLKEDELSDFRTIPAQKEDRRRICRCLMREGVNLKGIPGFYKNRYGSWDINFYQGNDGYLCPEYSADGKMYGFQIRLANPTPDKKYVSFTSSGKANGSSGGARATYLWGDNKETVIITEGILKASVIYHLLHKNFSVVGIPGINQKNCLDQVLAALKQRGVKKIFQAYDMDRCESTICKRDYKPDKCMLCSCGVHDYMCRECSEKVRKKNGLGKSWLYLQNQAISSGFLFKRLLWGLNKDKIWDGIHKGFDDYLCAITSLENDQYKSIADVEKYLLS